MLTSLSYAKKHPFVFEHQLTNPNLFIMKKLRTLCLILFGSLVLISCGKKKQENQSTSKDKPKKESTLKKVGKAFDQVKQTRDAVSDVDDLKDLSEKLQQMEPISNADLKSFFPEKLDGMERKSFKVGDSESFMNITQGEAIYSDENRRLQITVTDGAGETGAAIIPMSFWALRRSSESETEKGFSKTTKKDGRNMKIEQTKNGDHTDSSMEFDHQNRFLVQLKGKNYTAEELEKPYKKLDYSKLK